MARNSNGFLSTDTELIGFGGGKEYSGASGIYVDNEQNIISITGDVGKEYNGIEPIVVNNDENLISANSAPIGVQEPLYFVQDDDEAVIIGLSGEYVTPSDITGKLDTSSFESWQQGQYTNDLTAINEKINEVSSNIPSLEGYATEQWVEDKGYLTGVDLSNYYTKDETSGADQIAEALSNLTAGDIEVNELVHSNSGTWNTVTDKLDTSAQVISSCETTAIDDKTLVTKLNEKEISAGYAGSAAIANIALKDYQGNSFVPFYAKTSALENKLDTTAFSDVSGDFLTAHQSLSDYYRKDETSGKEELADAFANIPAGDTEVNAYVHNNSASIDGTSTVVQSNSSTWSDITAYQSNSASYLTAHQDLSDYQTTAGMVDYQTTAGMSDYATTAQLADKIDNSAITLKSIPGFGNIVSGISGYKLYSYTAENSQWANVAGRAYKDNNGNDITATYLTTAATANFATTGDLALKQDTLTFGYDEQDRINSINNSALAGGGDVPEDVMVETNLEYNAVNEISGYNGSAIAQYGAEKQWLVHDDTLVHAANSAQYALGVNVSALQRLMGIDQTLLYSGTATNNGNLNESIENFDTIKVNYITDDGMQGVTEFMPSYTKTISLDSMYVAQNSAVWFKATNYTFSANTSFNSYPYQLFKANNGLTAAWSNNTANSTFRITRVIGIGRKQ